MSGLVGDNERDALDVKVISRVLTLPASGSLIALAIPGKVGTDIAPANLGQYKRTQSDMATHTSQDSRK